jgi:hypothetical protein
VSGHSLLKLPPAVVCSGSAAVQLLESVGALGRLDLAPVVPSNQATPVSCHEAFLPDSRMSHRAEASRVHGAQTAEVPEA